VCKGITADVGQSFGEDSALNGCKSQEVIEAASDTVETYRVSRSMLLQYFGGSASEVIYAIRASIQAKKNWLQLKLLQLAGMKKEDLLKAGAFKDELECKGLNPTKTIPGETPYLKSVQTYGRDMKPTIEPLPKQKVEEEKGPPASGEEIPTAPPKVELKPKSRAELMRKLERPSEGGEDKKYDTVMGFGTMRLVASDRMKELNPRQMNGLVTLRSIAQDVKAGGKQKTEGRGEFNKETVKRFQNTVMMADPAIAEKTKEALKAPSAAGGNLFRKMLNINAGDLAKAKFGQ